MLRFERVGKRFPDGPVALRDLSFSVPGGQFCVVLGPSGAGKSTLLRTVNGLVTPTSGRVFVDGEEVAPRSLPRVRPRVATIHQQFHLVPRLSVCDNVLAGALAHVPTWRALLGLFPARLQRKACELLAQMGLGEEHLDRRAQTLSGGEQQRVAIARAFVLEPAVVLADEPVASLDPRTSATILTLLKDASRRRGTTVLCSLHQVGLAREYADRVIALRAGEMVHDGSPAGLDPATVAWIYGSPHAQP